MSSLVVVQVLTLEVLFLGLGSVSLAETVAVLVTHAPAFCGAVPVTVMVKVSPLSSSPSAHCTVAGLPTMLQPGVDVVKLVIPAGAASSTTKPELLPGPLLVTVMVQVMVPSGATVAGPVLTMLRSVPGAEQAAPSLTLTF